ncbi:hypothetical protein [Chitinophaga arvensicola]|uniref:DUF4468 domain-containing protein n=1 Tax=Chitinophaga arvensicola TaxID=29529 RepID=A0A1I0S558_9BACT|nr:hypothetical protein [Chitinophaga arvensicola]SEW49756.1 hypothetical protein SAMN04488122_3561 [Chitinophaga arvensicola]
MKKCYLLFSILLIIWGIPTFAQQGPNPGSRAKAAAVFTKLLNDAASAYPPELSNLTESMAKIESSFRVNEEGILSVTFRYPVENSYSLYRLTAPVSAIKGIFYDYYIGLEFAANVVKIEESDKGSRELKENNTLALFHIARPGDGPEGEKLKIKMEQALQVFQENYK